MHAFIETASNYVHSSKRKAYEKALALGIPYESFQYVPLQQIDRKQFAKRTDVEVSFHRIEKAIFPECRNSVFVFVNGHFSEALSRRNALPQAVFAMPLSDAEIQFEAFLAGRSEALLREEKDPLSLLNYACCEEGVFLYVPPKVKLDVPVQILHVYADGGAFYCPRTILFMGKDSHCDLYCNELFLGTSTGWSNSALDIVLEERASLNMYSLLDKAKEMIHTDCVRALLKKSSIFKSLSFGSGKQIQRLDYGITLQQNANAVLTGAFLLNEKLETHIHTDVIHKEESAYSLQKFKTALKDQSRISFTGKIHVHKEAQKTQAYQLNNNMILSDLARVFSKPNLEIFADDVKASHGATIGKLDEENLFYFKTRGLSDEIARKLLIEGFYQEILAQIPLNSVKTYAQRTQ